MAPRTTGGLERREFLQTIGAGSLLLAVTATGCRVDDDLRGAAKTPTATVEPGVYLRLDDTGAVTVIVHRSEMGQGIRTSLAMVVADELEADWKTVRVEQADGDEKKYGDQNTDGSASLRSFLLPLRKAGATGRTLLEAAAAKQWNVPATETEARNGEVIHTPTGRRVAFAKLIATAKTLPAPDVASVRLKDPKAFRYIGKEIPSLDLVDMTTGRAQYAMDVHRDGMKIAVIERPPVLGATIVSVDSSEAEKVPGVEKVIQLAVAPPPSGFLPVGGVAVVARNTWAALQGRKKLKIVWSDGPHGVYDSDTYRADLERTSKKPGKLVRNQGNVATALRGAAKHVEADYHIPHLAHAQMEPPSALAVVANGRCEVWACTQNPQGSRDTLAQALKIPAENVTVHVTLLGGGFGRKSKPDFIVEAALLAREVGAPVRIVWTREDDIQHDYFHTVAGEHLEGGLDRDGKVTAWLHRSVLPSIGATFAPNVMYQGDSEMAQGITDMPYAIPNVRAESGPAPAHARIGWYRSVINIPHAFAISSFVDELAHEAGQDPKAFLLALLGPDRIIDVEKTGLVGKPWNYGESFADHPLDTARARRAIELVAQQAGWGGTLPAGEGRGIAFHRSFLSYVASVVHVAVGADGVVRIPRVDIAIDAGFVAHPERVRSQMEGGTIMALGNALYGEITFKQGRPVQANFDGYRVMRLDGAPRDLRVHIVPSDARSGGVGEPGVPPTAPALANAIFAATGKRIRRLPIGAQLAAVGPAKT